MLVPSTERNFPTKPDKNKSISYQKTVFKNFGEESAIRWNMDFNYIYSYAIENIVTRIILQALSFSIDQYILNSSQLISHLLICDPCHTSHRQNYGTKGKTDQELVKISYAVTDLLYVFREELHLSFMREK